MSQRMRDQAANAAGQVCDYSTASHGGGSRKGICKFV